MRRWVVALALVVALSPFVAAGCGTDAVGVQACQQIEQARCVAAQYCPNIQLTPPYYTAGTAVEACIRFYDVACLHGLEVNPGPNPTQVNTCVSAILARGACGVVETPQSSVACAWLIPPASVPEAAADSEAGEAEAAPSDVATDPIDAPEEPDSLFF